ncbi:DUF1566 domain-containing protein [Idiomarina sp. HP20-50]|uniref:Lcl C-terminal domain-containing protein n=1 Tax=Idiomarina sp. HP20-50 TaxID=3070813 RepID=UPI00294ADE4F|nr:DUF1566 domain-containing protein [Idiomarina sp. HP20-50]MDV6317195.1 DUF1566 domain-containing protein [Idiomarina sp. HP20-50]
MKFKILTISLVSLFISACASTTQKVSGLNCRPSLVDNKDGTITDTETNLMWAAKDHFYETLTGGTRWVGWDGAMSKAENSEVQGYTDWRVPTEKELMTILNSNCKSQGTKIVERFSISMSPLFGHPTYPIFWTSVEKDERAIVVDFEEGTAREAPKEAGNTVRLVRDID